MVNCVVWTVSNSVVETVLLTGYDRRLTVWADARAAAWRGRLDPQGVRVSGCCDGAWTLAVQHGHIPQPPWPLAVQHGHIPQPPWTLAVQHGHIPQPPWPLAVQHGHIPQPPWPLAVQHGHIPQPPWPLAVQHGHIPQPSWPLAVQHGHIPQPCELIRFVLCLRGLREAANPVWRPRRTWTIGVWAGLIEIQVCRLSGRLLFWDHRFQEYHWKLLIFCMYMGLYVTCWVGIELNATDKKV